MTTMNTLISLSLPPKPGVPPSCFPKLPPLRRGRICATALPMPYNPPRSRHAKHPQLETLKSRLIRAAELGTIAEAFSVLDLMAARDVPADLVIYSVLLKSCIQRRDLARGDLARERLAQSGLEPNSIFMNSLINLYAKCGQLDRAREVFEEMGDKRNLVSWTSMISACANNGTGYMAVGMFIEMMELGFRPDGFSFSSVFQACCLHPSLLLVGLPAFGMSIKTGFFGEHVRVGCSLIDMFAKFDDLASARKVFDQMPNRDIVTWTLLITRCAQNGLADDAMELFLNMLEDGDVKPDHFTMSSVISACTRLGSPSRLGLQLHSLAIRLGSSQDVCLGCALVEMYANCAAEGSIENARKVFDRMTNHSIMSWTALIGGYVQAGGQDAEAF